MHDPDHAWVDDFLDRLLALWRQHADTPTGLFNPYLDRQWRHHVDGPRTLVTQCRLIYNFARAFERSGDQAYGELARRGIDALMRYFHDAEETVGFGPAGPMGASRMTPTTPTVTPS